MFGEIAETLVAAVYELAVAYIGIQKPFGQRSIAVI